jgi:hypothetical protein
MDDRNRPINFNIVSMGTVDKTLVSPHNVFTPAMLSNAKSIVMFHNHPSGELTPSRFDFMATSKLIEAGNALGIPIQDHVIIGGGSAHFYSMRQNHKGMFANMDSFMEHTGGEPTVRLADSKNAKYVSIMDYSTEKKVDVHVVNGYISAHRKEFSGHIARGSKGAALDDFAREKIDKYLESRPKKGNRFKMNDEEMIKQQDSKVVMDTQKDKDTDPAYGDEELGVDVPDRSDGADDRMSITQSVPSKNPRKSRGVGAKHYKIPKNKNEVQESVESKPETKITESKINSSPVHAKDDFEMER